MFQTKKTAHAKAPRQSVPGPLGKWQAGDTAGAKGVGQRSKTKEVTGKGVGARDVGLYRSLQGF